MEDRTGQRLDTYRLLRYLGSGSFGEVYLAEHVVHHTTVAIKIFPRFAEKDLPAFLNEARIIRLKHPHILPVLDFGIDKSEPFLVTEYIPAGTVRTHYPKGTRLPIARVAPYIQQIASALQFAHNEKLVHRDVKPENILMRSDTELLLGDFGVVAIAYSSSSLHVQNTAGTLYYMAPEQIKGKAVLASDQYALGVIAYEWLCGERPFQGSVGELIGQHLESPPPSLRKKREDLSRAVEDVIWTALAKDPTRRYPSVQAFADALSQACGTSGQGKHITREIPRIFVSMTRPPHSTTRPVIAPEAEEKSSDSNLTQMKNHPLTQPITPPALHVADSLASNVQPLPTVSGLDSSNFLSLTGTPPKQPRRLFIYPLLILVLLVLMILAAGGSGVYYLVHTNQQRQNDQELVNVQALLDQAQREAAQNPAQALQTLAQAQQRLRSLKQSGQLDAGESAQLTTLQNRLVDTTRSAITSYNQHDLITLLPCAGASQTSVLSRSTANALAVLTHAGTPAYYTLGADGRIHLFLPATATTTASETSAVSTSALADALVIGMVGLKNQLVALSVPASDNPGATYDIDVLNPGNQGVLQLGSTIQLDPLLLSTGQTPAQIAAWSDGQTTEIFVALSSAASRSSTVLAYVVSGKKPTLMPIVEVPGRTLALTAVAGQLFLLLASGQIESLHIAPDHTLAQQPVPVLLDQPIAPPLTASARPFTLQSAVPVVPLPTTKGSSPLVFPSSPTPSPLLSAAPNADMSSYHLFIADPAHQRVLDLAPLNQGQTANLTLTLTRQYVAPASFHLMKGLATPDDTTFYLLSQTSPVDETLMTIATGATPCLT